MDAAIDRWNEMFATLDSAPDFSTTEYSALAKAHLESHGTSTTTIALVVRWQSGCLRALADNRPAPVPPPGLDLNALMDRAQRDAGQPNKTPSLSAMQAAERVTASPLEADALNDISLKTEYTQLVEDHSGLLETGDNYQRLDPSKKLSFLDQLDSIEDRWGLFFDRFQLSDNSLNQDYLDQCQQYLSSMKLTEEEYFQLLKDTNQLMRQDATHELIDKQ